MIGRGEPLTLVPIRCPAFLALARRPGGTRAFEVEEDRKTARWLCYLRRFLLLLIYHISKRPTWISFDVDFYFFSLSLMVISLEVSQILPYSVLVMSSFLTRAPILPDGLT